MNRLLLYVLCVSIVACKTSPSNEDKTATASTFQLDRTVEAPQVTTTAATQVVFNREILSNGKISAKLKAEIKFPFAEIVNNVLIQNGDRVQQGQLLATLNTAAIEQRLNRNKEALEKATIDLDDRLIDYGYRLKDSASIPAGIYKMALLKSNINTIRMDYQQAEEEYKQSRITAPFSGVIADVEARPYNRSDIFRKVCVLMDNNTMDVDFNLLEQELPFVKKGLPVTVRATNGDSTYYTGYVTSVNPVIDANGMATVKASVHNTSGKLIDGLSASVVIKISRGTKLVIPKTALLQRQNKWVVFTCEKDKAVWNYVETGEENTTSVVITSGLKPGQKVIISNNANLAHDEPITIIEN